MKAGRELDALVAEKVMGLRLAANSCTYLVSGYDDPEGWADSDTEWADVPNYSTDIAAAWEVVEKISVKDGTVLVIPERNMIAIDDDYALCDDQGWIWSVDGESIPHAICLAALKAVEGENG